MPDAPPPAPGGSFAVAAEHYDRYIGRYGEALAGELIAIAGVRAGMTAIDIGCGTGKLTGALVAALGADRVRAVEPSPPFAAACRERHPGVDVREAAAEALPFADASADRVLSQLVVNFIGDPVRGLAEMRRVVVAGGVVAALVWDYGGAMRLLRAFWDAAAETDPTGDAAARDEGRTMRLGQPSELERLWRDAGLEQVAVRPVDVGARWSAFEEIWSALEAGVGPSGAWVAALDPPGRAALRDAFHRRLGSPQGAFEVAARAWCVTGVEPGA